MKHTSTKGSLKEGEVILTENVVGMTPETIMELLYRHFEAAQPKVTVHPLAAFLGRQAVLV
jgi:hypothetical protein